MKLEDVKFKDLTKDITAQDILVKENLTDNFEKVVASLGGLELASWEKTGIGDIVATVEWNQNFIQNKPILVDVNADAYAGFSFPSGHKRDEDLLFSVPFGNDGSWGVIWGGGLRLHWCFNVRGGFDLEFLQLFGSTKERRIKTFADQDDLIFLAKAKSILEPGFIQKYNLYLELYRFIHGLTFRIAYEHIKENDSKIFLLTNEFSNEVANTAENLQEWSINQMIFNVNYDFSNDINESCVNPQFSVFYKMPFGGKRSLQASTIGLTFALNF